MTDVNPQVRTIPKEIRNRSLDELLELALGRDRLKAADANEWYWVVRFNHPLIDHINVRGFLSLESKYAKALTAVEVAALTPTDLAVLATSASTHAREIAAGHKSTPPSSLSVLATDSDRAVRKAAGHNFSTPPEAIETMQRQACLSGSSDEISQVRLGWLWSEIESATLDSEVALEVARGFAGDDDHRLALARRRRAPLVIRKALASGHKMSAPVAEILADDSDPSVREAVAKNYQTPPEVLRRLSRDAKADVRVAAGVNSNLPDDAYRDLLRRRDRAVIAQVVANRGYSHGELTQLARSQDAEVRAAVAKNRSTPVPVLEALAEDVDQSVRAAVEDILGYESANALYGNYQLAFIWWYRRELGGAEESALARSSSARLRRLVATRLRPGDDLHALAEDSDPHVRAAAAANPLLAFSDLVSLANDPNEDVRKSTAEVVVNQLKVLQEPPAKTENWLEAVDELHPDLPLASYGAEVRIVSRRLRFGYPWMRPRSWTGQDLEPLATARSEGVRQAVAEYSGTVDSGMQPGRMAFAFAPVLTPGTLRVLLMDSSVSVRDAAFRNSGEIAAQVAAHPDTPSDILIGLARSTSVAVRAGVASNPTTGGPVLANLARDPEVSVRVEVASNPKSPTGAIDMLTADSSEEVLFELLSNPHAPARFLELQSLMPSDWHETGRHLRLAGNPGTPASVLRRMAYSRNAEVRVAVAANVSTPADSIEVLMVDESQQVREAANQRRDGT